MDDDLRELIIIVLIAILLITALIIIPCIILTAWAYDWDWKCVVAECVRDVGVRIK